MENFGFNITCEEVIERAISIDIIEGKRVYYYGTIFYESG